MSAPGRVVGGDLRRDGGPISAARRLLARFEAVMAAVAFAEVGEPDTARRMVA